MSGHIVFRPGISLDKLPAVKEFRSSARVMEDISRIQMEWEEATAGRMKSVNQVDLELLFSDIYACFYVEHRPLDS